MDELMGMFDYYEPVPAFVCPVCGTKLDEWQGKDAANGLFVWRQGNAGPIDQRVDDEIKLPAAKRALVRLPERFELYTDSCGKHFVIACGRREGEIWKATEITEVSSIPRKA